MPDDKVFVEVDSQILNSMQLCPERYRLEFIEDWRPNRKPKAFERGHIIHLMLAHYYEERRNVYVDGSNEILVQGRTKPEDQYALVQECLHIGRVAASNTMHIDEEEYEEDQRVFKEYILRHQHDGWEVLAVEQPFSKVLFDNDQLHIDYIGIIDLLILDPKLGKAVVDTKSESRESNPFELSNQFQGYEWASGGLPVIINKVGYQKNAKMETNVKTGQPIDMRFRRIVHQTGEEAIQEWKEDAIQQVVEALGWHKRIAQGKRLKKNRTSCDKYSGCIYQAVCKEPNEIREHKLIAYFYKDKWDPFKRGEQRMEPVGSL